MNIKILSADCAKISLTRRECAGYGIAYDEFTPDNDSAKLFLAMVLARLEILGNIRLNSDRITAEVFPQSDGGMIIYLSGKGLSQAEPKTAEEKLSAVVCDTSDEVLRAVKRLHDGGRLYKYRGKYLLITSEDIGGGKISVIDAARAEEYGKLLCGNVAEYLGDIT